MNWPMHEKRTSISSSCFFCEGERIDFFINTCVGKLSMFSIIIEIKIKFSAFINDKSTQMNQEKPTVGTVLLSIVLANLNVLFYACSGAFLARRRLVPDAAAK